MTSLRQRLLLVAGWAVAAVATGLVSAGAVAVAGGQVTDRPLQPLSAAEVAALPGTIEDPCVTSEPLASGGSASSATCPDRVSSDGPFAPGDVAARPAEKEESNQVALAPIDVPESAATDDASFDESFPEDAEIPPVGPQPAGPQVVELIGGTVSVSVVNQSAIVLNAATPRPGYVADLRFDRFDELTVSFWNGQHLSSVTATVNDDGELELTPQETTT